MSETAQSADLRRTSEPQPPRKRPLHRVCIQCNNMFVVDPERFDAKQCPNCHKG